MVFLGVQVSLLISLFAVTIISFMSLVNSQFMDNIDKKLSVWISTRKKYKSLDVSLDLDEVLFKYRWHIGLLGMIVSVVMIITCLLSMR